MATKAADSNKQFRAPMRRCPEYIIGVMINYLSVKAQGLIIDHHPPEYVPVQFLSAAD